MAIKIYKKHKKIIKYKKYKKLIKYKKHGKDEPIFTLAQFNWS